MAKLPDLDVMASTAAAGKTKPETRAQQAERHHSFMTHDHRESYAQAERHHSDRRGWYDDEKARNDGWEMSRAKMFRDMSLYMIARTLVNAGILAALIYMMLHYN